MIDMQYIIDLCRGNIYSRLWEELVAWKRRADDLELEILEYSPSPIAGDLEVVELVLLNLLESLRYLTLWPVPAIGGISLS
jgi:hypothetical protein